MQQFITHKTSIKQEEADSASIANGGGDQVDEKSVTNPPEPMEIDEARNNMKRKNDDQDELEVLLQDISTETNAKKAKMDKYSVFGEVVATELRDIKSDTGVLDLKSKILDLIYETRIHVLCAAKLIEKSSDHKENVFYVPEF